MTGGQDSAGTGRLEAICAGIGVAPEHIRVVVPLKKNYEEMKQIIREEIEQTIRTGTGSTTIEITGIILNSGAMP